MNTTISVDGKRMQALAVVESITSLEDLQNVLAGERRPAEFRLEQCRESPNGYTWYNILIDVADAADAVRTVRSVLFALLDGADRGVVEHFRIVIGADMLRRPEPGTWRGNEAGGDPCIA